MTSQAIIRLTTEVGKAKIIKVKKFIPSSGWVSSI